MWKPPSLSVIWPPFVKPDLGEEAQLVTLTAQAKQAGLVTTQMALEKLRTVFPFENIAEIAEKLEEDAKHRADIEHMLAQAMKASSGEDENEDENEDAAEKAS